jgi:monoamine oxidase
MNEIEFVDVVIIGAGFAGLSAANYLSSKSIKCLVIEGRSRVGGRTLSKKVLDDELTIDLGGQWIGPNQERILSVVKEFNLELIEQTWHHQNPNYLGEIIGLKPLNCIQLKQVLEMNFQWDKMALELKSVEEAFEHENSCLWSMISVDKFVEDHPLCEDFRVKQELKLEILTLTGLFCFYFSNVKYCFKKRVMLIKFHYYIG